MSVSVSNKERSSFEWISSVLIAPDTIESDSNDPTLLHVVKEISEKGFRKLWVVYNETTEPVTIVTAYFE